jgi:hypothetical protein
MELFNVMIEEGWEDLPTESEMNLYLEGNETTLFMDNNTTPSVDHDAFSAESPWSPHTTGTGSYIGENYYAIGSPEEHMSPRSHKKDDMM